MKAPKPEVSNVSSKQASSASVTRQLLAVEKLSQALTQRVGSFYEQGIDLKYIESSNLDSKILMQTKINQHSGATRELILQKQRLDELIQPHQQQSRVILDDILHLLIDKKNSRRHFEIILGTILLNYPIDKSDAKFSNRIEISKSLKPMYQSALMSLLLDSILKDGYQFKSHYLLDLLSDYKLEQIKIQESKEKEVRNRKQVSQNPALTELQQIFIEIIYLKEMGLYSPKSLEILERTGENNLLDMNNRRELLLQSKRCAQQFHHYGVGVLEVSAVLPVDSTYRSRSFYNKKFNIEEKQQIQKQELEKKQQEKDKAERIAQMKQATRFTFIKEQMDPKADSGSEIEQLLKVCRVYSSFILSVKTTVDKELHIKAYEMMLKQAQAGELNQYFTEKLLAMMGRFPIGSGIYFIEMRRHAHENGSVDKSVVVGLNPFDADEPIVRRVTTNYRYKLAVTTGTVSKAYNLYFAGARSVEIFSEKLQKRFRTQYKVEDGDMHYSFRANDAFRTLAISDKKLW
ncbi:MAG: hypothetical protein OFPI_23220 [Osedax symbiont Rs2]|nr:MAG: hypothetical protein OFPI_23220 [Osedax symbiont Rs2]